MRRALVLLVPLLLAVPCGFGGSGSVVLVVRADSGIFDLDSVTVHKLFLGVPVLINGRPLHPIRNRADERLDQIFLQEIAAMSQSAYDRQILIGVNRQGWQPPVEVDSTARVIDKLLADPSAVSFVWQREVGRDPRIRVLRVIWTD
jgi:hypothetical protein